MSSDPQDPTPYQPQDDSREIELRRQLEYTEGTSIGEIHGAIMRENDDPQDGLEPVPLWLTLFFGAVVFWAGGYLFFYSGGFRPDVYDELAVNWSGGGSGEKAKVDPVAMGKKFYTGYCSACHQSTGLGVPGQYPPLAGSAVVLSKDAWGENHLSKILLNGLGGPINVNGTMYNNNMPAQGNLSDEQIAYILTYIRQEWGNAAGPITPEGVAAMRKADAGRSQPWTEAEMKTIPPAAMSAPSPAPAGTTPPAAPAAPVLAPVPAPKT